MKKGTIVAGMTLVLLMAGTGLVFAQETADSLVQKGMLAFADDNQQEAFGWFQKAAQLGDARSEVLTANCLLAGNGVVKDDTQAISWLQKASEQGYAEAQAELGVFYLQGKFVAKDDTQASKWLQLASAQNNARANHYLSLYKSMAPQQDAVVVAER